MWVVGELRRQQLSNRLVRFSQVRYSLDNINITSFKGFIRSLGEMKKSLTETRYFTYVFVSIWKMLVFFTSMIYCIWLTGYNVGQFFNVAQAFQVHPVNVTEVSLHLEDAFVSRFQEQQLTRLKID